MSSGPVAIVVPLPSRPSLTADEEISLRHLLHFLGRYDRYFIAPRSVPFKRRGFGTVTFPDRYFGSGQAHARLQLSEEFYARFQGYQYILMYHLDALALSDQLLEWCDADLDYVGAPWLQCPDSPWVTRPRVGNSGFALMRIQSFLNVLQSRRPEVEPEAYWQRLCAATPRHRQWLNLPKRYLKRLRMFNGVRWETRRWAESLASDFFWSDRAIAYWPQFRVASVDTGLEFAFEVAPRMCLQLAGGRLPFGCHAWPRYDRDFWQPHLLR